MAKWLAASALDNTATKIFPPGLAFLHPGLKLCETLCTEGTVTIATQGGSLRS